jgi:predicted GIY-YIG superfamily endonuclease
MELHADRLSAIAWEKTLEEWRRAWKTALNEQDKLPA